MEVVCLALTEIGILGHVQVASSFEKLNRKRDGQLKRSTKKELNSSYIVKVASFAIAFSIPRCPACTCRYGVFRSRGCR